MIDIIIPVLNEESCLREHELYFEALAKNSNLIFSDGGSSDDTIYLAKQLGDVVCSKKGRASQKNRGAECAKSEYLLFLHVDSMISVSSLSKVEDVLSRGYVGGCFKMSILDRRYIFRVFERMVNLSAKCFKLIDGDLGQFVRKDIFHSIGGFDDVLIMEDIIFGRQLKKAGEFIHFPDVIEASSRKWDDVGFMRLFLRYAKAYTKYFTSIQ